MLLNFLVTLASLLFSLMLSIAPLPDELLPMNPVWSLLTLLFWNYHFPRRINVGIAWCVGIAMDGLTGSLLGMHAFSFVITIYIFDLLHRRFHMFHLLQQSVMIGMLVFANFIINACVTHIFTDNLIIWSAILSVLTSAICWPFYELIARKLSLLRG